MLWSSCRWICPNLIWLTLQWFSVGPSIISQSCIQSRLLAAVVHLNHSSTPFLLFPSGSDCKSELESSSNLPSSQSLTRILTAITQAVKWQIIHQALWQTLQMRTLQWLLAWLRVQEGPGLNIKYYLKFNEVLGDIPAVRKALRHANKCHWAQSTEHPHLHFCLSIPFLGSPYPQSSLPLQGRRPGCF